MEKPEFITEIKLKTPLQEDSYLNGLPAVRFLAENGLRFKSRVTFFVGENGTGKSTLLEAIAIASGFNPEGGTRNFSFETKRDYSELYKYLGTAKKAFPKDGFFLRAESFYNAASYIDEIYEGDGRLDENYGGSLHEKSHGESFLALVENRFRGNGLYLLDEPEAALSPTRIMTLIAEINRLVNDNSQFIIATHSPIMMAFPGAETLEFSENGIKPVDYKETEHFQVTKSFLDNPERMLGILLEE